MSELEDRINSVLGDPKQMEKIAKLAKSFMAGGDVGASASGSASASEGLFGADLDPKLIGRISKLLSSDSGEKKQERALLEAMMPFLSEKRRGKMNKALKLARIAGIAKAAMGEMGAEDDD